MSSAFYFEVEVKKREMLSRLALAAVLADKGSISFVGPRVTVRKLKRLLEGGLLVRKSISPHERGVIQEIVSEGYGCVAMDEEGLLVDELERFASLRHSNETVALTDRVFLWGKAQKDYLVSSFPKYPGKFSVLGNPRVALWRARYFGIYDKEVTDIKKSHRDYVLFVSNFAVFTNRNLCERMLHEAGYFESGDNVSRHLEHTKRVEFLFNKFVSAAKAVSCTGMKVVFRPHPSDDVDYIRSCFSGCDNVLVEGSGEVSPWILGASAMVHNCCTTAVEGALSGAKVLSYCPDNISQYNLDAVNGLGEIVSCEEELLKSISGFKAVSGDLTINGFLDPDISLEEMADSLNEIAREAEFVIKYGAIHSYFYTPFMIFKAFARKIKDAFLVGRAKRVERSTLRSKFPPTFPDELNELLRALHEHGVVSRVYRAVPVAENTFYLSN